MWKKLCLIVVFGLFISMIISSYRDYYSEWKLENSGTPDLVSCIATDDMYFLSIIANSKEIDDADKFTQRIIDMCHKNVFRSIRFTKDIRTVKLEIAVYLNKKEMKTGQFVGTIQYDPQSRSAKCKMEDMEFLINI